MCKERESYELYPFFRTLELQLSFYRSLCYNSRSHCPLLQCLLIKSAIQAGAHSYFVISFKCEGKKCCHDLIPTLEFNIFLRGFIALDVDHFYMFLLNRNRKKPEYRQFYFLKSFQNVPHYPNLFLLELII